MTIMNMKVAEHIILEIRIIVVKLTKQHPRDTAAAEPAFKKGL